MIPREILKKIRQIELRTNRLVTETLAGALLQPSPQFRRIARAVENGNDADEVNFNPKINAVFLEDFNAGLASFPADRSESFRVCKDAFNSRINFGLKSLAQTGLLRIIPNHCVFQFHPRFRVKNYLPLHERTLIRSFISARTVSHGMPLAGLRRSSSPRRSNSASCSGVGSSLKSPNSKSISSTSSRRSVSGIWRNSSRISVLLMESNLPPLNIFASP
jgi:hypothetical protein